MDKAPPWVRRIIRSFCSSSKSRRTVASVIFNAALKSLTRTALRSLMIWSITRFRSSASIVATILYLQDTNTLPDIFVFVNFSLNICENVNICTVAAEMTRHDNALSVEMRERGSTLRKYYNAFGVKRCRKIMDYTTITSACALTASMSSFGAPSLVISRSISDHSAYMEMALVVNFELSARTMAFRLFLSTSVLN